MKHRYFLLLSVLFLATGTSAQEWVISQEKGAKLSPFLFSDSTRQTGKELYNLNCKSCHGDPGKNNAVKLVPQPPDPASLQMQMNSDGALYSKVEEGRGPMPSFRNTLTVSDKWKIISYLRGTNDKYIQEVAKKVAFGTAFEKVEFHLYWNREQKSVQVSVSGIREMKRQPVSGAEFKLFVKRYFGNLPVDAAKASDVQGNVSFNFPPDLPGDSAGRVRLLVKPVDEAALGEVSMDTVMNIGVPSYRPPLNEPRALWNVVQKTPVWLLLVYLISVLTVWGFILYVLLLLRALYKSGVEKDPKI